jgi:hypothetical protein
MRQKHTFKYIKMFGLRIECTLDNEESYKMRSSIFTLLITTK